MAMHVGRAYRRVAAIAVDGTVSPDEWGPLERPRMLVVERTAEGLSPVRHHALVLWDDASLYVAVVASGPPTRGARVELMLKPVLYSPERKPHLLVVTGAPDGAWRCAATAAPDTATALRDAGRFAARRGKDGWSCEWRIPFSAMGLEAADVRTLLFNMGLSCTASGSWVAWAPTGGPVCDVDLAGELTLKR